LLIGRSGNNKNTQDIYWLPDGLLDMKGRNEILIMQWTRGAEPYLGEISLIPDHEKTWYYESLGTR
jgi:hypothetical protein